MEIEKETQIKRNKEIETQRYRGKGGYTDKRTQTHTQTQTDSQRDREIGETQKDRENQKEKKDRYRDWARLTEAGNGLETKQKKRER